MILMTWQAKDWDDTVKIPNFQEYDALKDVLGIPRDKKTFWCFPANNVQQAVVNSLCTEVPCSQKLIIFETDDFYMIDKCEWIRQFEMYMSDPDEEKDDMVIDKDSLNPVCADAAEYIVTDIPEKHFVLSIDMKELKSFDFQNLEPEQQMAMQKFEKDKDLFSSALKAFEAGLATMEDIAVDFYGGEDDRIARAIARERIRKQFFDVYMLPAIYYIIKILGTSDYTNNTAEGLEWNFLSPLDVIEIPNDYTRWVMDIANYDRLGNYIRLTEIYKKILNKLFVIPPEEKYGRKIGPNELCPCGSGKKFKKCCKRTDNEAEKLLPLMSEGIAM